MKYNVRATEAPHEVLGALNAPDHTLHGPVISFPIYMSPARKVPVRRFRTVALMTPGALNAPNPPMSGPVIFRILEAPATRVSVGGGHIVSLTVREFRHPGVNTITEWAFAVPRGEWPALKELLT